MKILITGVAGFIGSHIADELVEKGHTVIGIDDLSSGSVDNLKSEVVFRKHSVRWVEGAVLRCHKNIDLVIHCAAQTDVRASVKCPVSDANSNILESLYLLEAMRRNGISRIIFLSTGGAIYGDAEQIPTPETEIPKPLSPYGIAKYSIENYLRFYSEVHGIKSTVLRFSNVYGSRNKKGIIGLCLDRVKRRQKIEIFGGEQTRDYIHVSDIVSAVILSIEKKIEGTFNVGTGVETSLFELLDLLHIRHSQYVSIVARKDGELLRSCLDASLLESRGWKPKMSLKEGLSLSSKSL